VGASADRAEGERELGRHERTEFDGVGREMIRNGVLDHPQELLGSLDTSDAELVQELHYNQLHLRGGTHP
jgi:hypothetical protein